MQVNSPVPLRKTRDFPSWSMKTTVASWATAAGAADIANLIKSSSLGVECIGCGICAMARAGQRNRAAIAVCVRNLMTSSRLHLGIVSYEHCAGKLQCLRERLVPLQALILG